MMVFADDGLPADMSFARIALLLDMSLDEVIARYAPGRSRTPAQRGR